jgi:hypothetical protein
MRLVLLIFGAVSGWFLGSFAGVALSAAIRAYDAHFHSELASRPSVGALSTQDVAWICAQLLGAIIGTLAASRFSERRGPDRRASE